MLNDATCFKAVYIITGYTDLRAGMDRLAAVIESQTGSRLKCYNKVVTGVANKI